MSRYIDAEELNKLLSEAKNSNLVFNGGICKAQMIVREMPTAVVEEVKRGEWKRYDDIFYCPFCNSSHPHISPRCSYCGAILILNNTRKGR